MHISIVYLGHQMSREYIKFSRIKDCLPSIASGTALNLKSQKKINWLSHQGPDGRAWGSLWVDINLLHDWTILKGVIFSELLKEKIIRWSIKTQNLNMERQD